MEKAGFKKQKGTAYERDRLRHKGIFCISNEWIKWAKKYMNRYQRRKDKQTKYYD